MVDWVPVWLLVPIGVLFIGMYASGVYLLLKKIQKKIPVWVPPFLALLTAATYAALAPDGPAPEYFVVPMLLLMLTFVVMAVIGAISFFDGKDMGLRPWIAVALVSYIAVFLLGIFFLGGSAETRLGSALPAFSFRFPLLGMVLDGIIGLLNLSSVAYFSPGYSILLGIGLYFEVFLYAAAVFFVMNYATEKKQMKR